MRFYRLSEAAAETFDGTPEAAMGLHFGLMRDGTREPIVAYVLSGQVAMVYDTEHERSAGAFDLPWMREMRNEGESAVRSWTRELEEAPGTLVPADPADSLVLGLVMNTPYYLPPTPRRPAYIYGHLPFTGRVQPGDTFYRCEHWSSSRRVDLRTGLVLAGTYGFPASELPFVPTGLAAVGRYALPNLPPACNRYEVRPPLGYTIHCGASVPLYGQAGGGVEIMLPRDFNNVGRIPSPTLLPPL